MREQTFGTRPSDQELRDELARTVMKTVALRNLGHMLTMRAPDGSAPIVVALGHERLSALLARVNSAGGAANVFVRYTEGRIGRISITVDGRPQLIEKGEHLGDTPIDTDVQLDMLAVWANQHDGKVSFDVVLPSGDARLEDLDEVENDHLFV